MRGRGLPRYLLLVVFAGGVAWATWKAGQTPEWAILHGNQAARVAACRDVWQKPAWRARPALLKLLQDREMVVRLAALEALTRQPLAELQPQVVALTADATAAVRARAYTYLLRPGAAERLDWAERLRQELADPAWRAANAGLLAPCAHVLLPAQPEQAAWFMELALAEPLPELRDELVLQAPALDGQRTRLVDSLDTATADDGRHDFVVALLAGIDGLMRGQAADDWRQASTPPPVRDPPLDRFTVEAEWASDLRPNFQIGETHGELGLILDEGAGGYLSWHKGEDSSVDIGRGRFRFSLANGGRYRLYARVWMENKCGNTTGMAIDGQGLERFSDATDVFRQWVWQPQGSLWLTAGLHVLAIEAWEDGTDVDKYALLPANERFDPLHPPPVNALYDASLPSSISFTAEQQHQVRGTTQTLTVWVRRNSESLTGGTLALTLPAPFRIVGQPTADLVFPTGVPIARASFRVHLPADAVAGEVQADATLTDAQGRVQATGHLFLGCHFDWLTTGPLPPYSPLAYQLCAHPDVTLAELRAPTWQHYPAAGFDRYRRLNFELGYGQASDKIIFLYTEFTVAEAGTYTSFLTSDDESNLYLDGSYLTGRQGDGQAEGLMVTSTHRIAAGRHRLLVSVTQSDLEDPVGPDADRHTYNNWCFKWLLRRHRYEIAPGIQGHPLVLPSK